MADTNEQRVAPEVAIAPPSNPLTEYMRKPAIYITLPSKGYFTKEGDVELTPNGEIAVSAMRTSDELLLKTPDALLNGDAIVRVIKSCAPGVKNVRDLPTPDVDALLIAIRASSYGDEMEFNANCPICDTQKHFAISLNESLTKMSYLEPEYIVTLSTGVKVSLKPHTYSSSTKYGLMTYNEGQLMNAVLNEDLEQPEKVKEYQESFNRIAELLVELTADSVVAIWDPEGNYIDATKAQILDWIKNIPRKDSEALQTKIAEINSTGVYKKVGLVCDNEECKHEWEADVSFDASDFFE